MNLDSYGLPVQADGDANDQLQRVAMLATFQALDTREFSTINYAVERGVYEAVVTCGRAIRNNDPVLQPSPGVYSRFVGGDPANVSADQLIPVLAAHVARRDTRQIYDMAKACIKRFGFAQNYKDGLNGSTKTKIPDFMLLRALPLFLRVHWLSYPAALIADLLLVVSALAAVGPVFRDGSLIPHKRGPDDVDDGVIITTLIVCRAVMPTPISWLAARLYSKLRPWNYGCLEDLVTDAHGHVYEFNEHAYSPIYGSLRWYHRAEAGGNPQIAELWKPLVDRYLA